MRIYVSGKMSGVPELNRPKFEKARKEILAFLPDAEIIIPHELELEKMVDETDESWYARLLLNDLETIRYVDTVVVLDDWEKSNGATVEAMFAIAVGVPVKTLGKFIIEEGAQ